MPPQKPCRVCGQSFPWTAEFWYAYEKGKLQTECKTCAKARIKAWRSARPEKVRFYHKRAVAKRVAERNGESIPSLLKPIPTHQTCSACRETFPLKDEFWHKNAARRCGLMAECKTCARKKAEAWYTAHRGDPVILERNRKHYQKNRVAVMAQTSAARRRRKLAPGRVTQFDIGVQFAKQNGLCFYCHKSIEGRKFDVDHFVPLIKGGTNHPKNIVLACPTCNKNKGAKLHSEFK